MKRRNEFLLIFLFFLSGILIFFSGEAKDGAMAGLYLAQNTILPSLLPLLIIFYMIMKTGANNVIVNILGNFTHTCFKLPKAASSAILFGLIGGYPTGAILSRTLYENGEISKQQARRMLRFNFCGGAAFIITGVGTITLNSQKAGLILFASNLLSSIILLVLTSFFDERDISTATQISDPLPIGEALGQSVDAGIRSVLQISAFIVLFSAIKNTVHFPAVVEPLLEITNGICSHSTFPLALTAAFLSFGGLCIHLQLLPIIKKFDMMYLDFLLFRIIGAGLSFLICKGLVMIFPTQTAVFSNASQTVSALSTANTALSVLMVLGCVVVLFDLKGRKRTV